MQIYIESNVNTYNNVCYPFRLAGTYGDHAHIITIRDTCDTEVS